MSRNNRLRFELSMASMSIFHSQTVVMLLIQPRRSMLPFATVLVVSRALVDPPNLIMSATSSEDIISTLEYAIAVNR